MGFQTLDYIIFAAYCLLIVFVGIWVSRGKKGEDKNASDYFLASKSLPWWAIGASLIASNISAEQFIGMTGSGFEIGLAIASYEWMAAVTLLVVAKFFLPIFLKKGIYTMPQYLEDRFDSRVRTSLAIFWLLVYVFVNLTSVLYLGSLALKTIMGIDLWYGVIFLAVFSAAYSLYGGLKAVALTDVVQVFFLVMGGLITTYLAVDAAGGDAGFFKGLDVMVTKASDKFDLILAKDSPFYSELPGIGVLLGGLWIANLNYWGFNQYIIQRALAAKSLKEAQRGLAMAGYLKILMPLIVVVPGIAAAVLNAPLEKPDEAYPWLLSNFVGTGIKGLAFAALIAAVVSSLSSMTNSISTIFTMDIYRNYIVKDAPEKKLVLVGRITAAISLIIAILVAPQLSVLGQAFQFIQEYTGFVSPGVVAIFLLGLFWKRTTANAALAGALLTIPLSAGFKFALPSVPFLDRMGFVFLLIIVFMVVISLIEGKKAHPKTVSVERSLFKTDPIFNILALGILGILAAIYALYW